MVAGNSNADFSLVVTFDNFGFGVIVGEDDSITPDNITLSVW